MIAHLFPRTDEESFLHPKEVAERIAAEYPGATVDWDRANRRLQSELERLEQSGAPDPVIAGHMNLFNNTVYIEVHPLGGSGNGVRFFVYLDSPIEVEATESGREAGSIQEQHLLAEIARCLKYDVEFDV